MKEDKDGKLVCHLGDFGTARKVESNNKFALNKNEKLNSTRVGSGDFMSPEVKNDEPNGTKTDSWSFGITIGSMLGLDEICPSGYKGGMAGFMRDCANSKHNLLLYKNGIYITTILKDLLKCCLIED